MQQVKAGPTGPVFGSPVTIRCRIEPQIQTILDPKGAEVVSTARLFATPEAKQHLVSEGRVTWGGQTYTIITVAEHWGLSAPSHVEARLR